MAASKNEVREALEAADHETGTYAHLSALFFPLRLIESLAENKRAARSAPNARAKHFLRGEQQRVRSPSAGPPIWQRGTGENAISCLPEISPGGACEQRAMHLSYVSTVRRSALSGQYIRA